jgi:hypothetical protein
MSQNIDHAPIQPHRIYNLEVLHYYMIKYKLYFTTMVVIFEFIFDTWPL